MRQVDQIGVLSGSERSPRMEGSIKRPETILGPHSEPDSTPVRVACPAPFNTPAISRMLAPPSHRFRSVGGHGGLDSAGC